MVMSNRQVGAGGSPVRGRDRRRRDDAAALCTDVTLYMRRIRETALLTAEEEKELGWRIINDRDSEARDRMIRANLRLVVAIGRDYVRRGLTLAEVIAEGNVGLIRAVEGFDPARGARFSTYASWWIKQAIKRALSAARSPVHVPSYMIDLIGQWREATRRLEGTLHRSPTRREVARVMDVPPSRLSVISSAARVYQTPQGTVTNEDGDAVEAIEILRDTVEERPESAVGIRDDVHVVGRLLGNLAERDARVLRLRYGLEGQPPMTLKEIGHELGVTRERVRQIEVAALRTLRLRMTGTVRSGQSATDGAAVGAACREAS
jgi:RNA polymerase primary sigma factor